MCARALDFVLSISGGERGRRGAVRAHHSLRGAPGEQAQRCRGLRAHGDEGNKETRAQETDGKQ